MLRRYHDVLDQVTTVFHWLSVGILLSLALLINADVAGRHFFDAPISGVSEMMGQAVVIFVFLQAPQAFRQRRFLRNDGLLQSLRQRRSRVARVLCFTLHGCAIAILLVLLIQSVPLLVKDWTSGDYVGAIGSFTVPLWPARLAVVIGGSVLVLQIALCALQAEAAEFRNDGLNL